MEFAKFIDNRTQEVQLKMKPEEGQPINNGYVINSAEVAAGHFILTSWQSCVKYLMIPKLFFHFVFMKLHIVEPPREQVIMNLIKRDQEAKRQAAVIAQKMIQERKDAALASLEGKSQPASTHDAPPPSSV